MGWSTAWEQVIHQSQSPAAQNLAEKLTGQSHAVVGHGTATHAAFERVQIGKTRNPATVSRLRDVASPLPALPFESVGGIPVKNR
jgi:hypothetical protein